VRKGTNGGVQERGMKPRLGRLSSETIDVPVPLQWQMAEPRLHAADGPGV